MSKNKEHQVSTYDTNTIHQDNRQSWIKILAIWAGLIFSVPSLLYGNVVATFLPLGQGLLAIFLGSVILGALTLMISIIGGDTGLPASEIFKYFFGTTGSKILSLMNALLSLGWVGIGATLIVDLLGFYIPFFASGIGYSIGCIVVMAWFVITVWTSFKGLSLLGLVALPIIVVIFIIALIQAERVYGVAQLFDNVPSNPQSFIYVVFAIVAVWINAPLQAPNHSRFSRSRKDTFIAIILAFAGASSLVFGVGTIIGMATGMSDVPSIFSALHIDVLAAILIVALGWTSACEAIYSISLSFASVFNTNRKIILLGLCYLVAVTFALVDLFTYFIYWVDIMGQIFAPVIALLITDYWVFRSKYKMSSDKIVVKFSFAALLAILLGVGSGLLFSSAAMLVSLVVTTVSYIILNKYIIPDKTLKLAAQLQAEQEKTMPSKEENTQTEDN